MAKKYVKKPFDHKRKLWLELHQNRIHFNAQVLPTRKPVAHIDVDENFSQEVLQCR